MFESNIHGGVSVISHRYAKANIPGSPDFNPPEEGIHSHLLYVDANNLYGWAMSQKLPTGNFNFLTEEEGKKFDVLKISDDSETGYIIECDLEYPSELHDLHNCYPLTPESQTITKDLLLPYCLSFEQKHTNCRKLVPNLLNKKKYVTHYRNLKLYLRLGMKLTKTYCILSFDQSEWMEPYIAFNTSKRQEAKTKFDKDFSKLANSATFGKTTENVRNRTNIQLVCDPRKVKKLISKPQLEQFRIINEETALIERVRAKVTLDKPVYCGFTILELSKL